MQLFTNGSWVESLARDKKSYSIILIIALNDDDDDDDDDYDCDDDDGDDGDDYDDDFKMNELKATVY